MDNPPASPEELITLLNESSEQLEEAKKPENLRYVIYARKSTDESSDKQVRSIGDQVAECKAMADAKGLNIVKIIKESESAKEPDIREGFREMLEDIKKGKYEGIVAWHPDRLARNMKDAGEVIDLIDKNIIGHLDFVSFSFQNDTSGKMLLGITFVLSKQYSDSLSDNVNRGNKRNIYEGKFIGKYKHGYTKDKNQYLNPDPKSFILIKNAWKLRLKGKTLDNIADFLNNSGYTRKLKYDSERKIFKMNKRHLSKIFKDTFYCGVLRYGEYLVNLEEVCDFTKMIDTDLFCTLNRIDEINIKLNRVPKKSVKADLLRGKVLCGGCGIARTSGITTKKMKDGTTKKIFYYKCETKACKFHGKSIRAKAVIEFIENLAGVTFLSRKL